MCSLKLHLVIMTDCDFDLYADEIEQDCDQPYDEDNTDLFDDVITEPPVTSTSGNSSSPTVTPPKMTSPYETKHNINTRYQLYVGNLTWWTTDQDVADCILDLGVEDMKDVIFFENRSNGQSKGFCTVSLGSEPSMRLCLERLPTKTLHGQNPVVTYPTKQALSEFESQSKTRPSPPPQLGLNRGYANIPPGGPRHNMGPPQMRNHPRSMLQRGPPPLRMGPPHMGPVSLPMPPGHSPNWQNQVMPNRPINATHMNMMVRRPPMPNPFQGPPPPTNQGPPRGPPPVIANRLPNMTQQVSHPDWVRPPGVPPQVGPGGFMQGLPPLGPPPERPPLIGGGVMPPVNNRALPPNPPGMYFHRSGGPPPQQGGPQLPPVQQGPPAPPPTHIFVGAQPPRAYSRPPPPAELLSEPGLTETEHAEILERNRSVCSSAISRGVADAANADYAGAIETLITAISLIKQSKVAHDDRCKILISSLQDTLHGVVSKSYTSSGRKERSRSRDRDRDRDRHRRSRRSRSREFRERSKDRDRYYSEGYSRDRSRSRPRERDRDYTDRSRESSVPRHTSSRGAIRGPNKSPDPDSTSASSNKGRYFEDRDRDRDSRRDRDRDREREHTDSTHRNNRH